MPTVYLFRIDGAKDNDEYFANMRSSVAHAYAGVEFRVGKVGWIPDLVRVVIEASPDRCTLTLIELEQTESVALISCRKYLPEDSDEILSDFSSYLDRVIPQCRVSADPRGPVFVGLRSLLSVTNEVTVATAGALRSATAFVEELRLIDQPRLAPNAPIPSASEPEIKRIISGTVRLSAKEVMTLARCIMILDSVVRRGDQSDANFVNWRMKAPLKRLLGQNEANYPILRSFVFKTENRGLTLDFEKVLAELVDIWSALRETQPNQDRMRTLLSDYFPIASEIKRHDQMTNVFEVARNYVDEAFK